MIISRPGFSFPMTALVLCASIFSTSSASAQSVMEECIQQGFKPGTSGFYRCLQKTSSGTTENDQETKNGEPGSILNGDPQDAVSDFSGSAMDGATAPDPNILKQFNPGGEPNR